MPTFPLGSLSDQMPQAYKLHFLSLALVDCLFKLDLSDMHWHPTNRDKPTGIQLNLFLSSICLVREHNKDFLKLNVNNKQFFQANASKFSFFWYKFDLDLIPTTVNSWSIFN